MTKEELLAIKPAELSTNHWLREILLQLIALNEKEELKQVPVMQRLRK